MRTTLLAAATLFMYCLTFAPNAYAYIDPGTGSMLLQALAAGLVSILVFWKRISAGIVTLFSKNRTDESAGGTEAAGSDGSQNDE